MTSDEKELLTKVLTKNNKELRKKIKAVSEKVKLPEQEVALDIFFNLADFSRDIRQKKENSLLEAASVIAALQLQYTWDLDVSEEKEGIVSDLNVLTAAISLICTEIISMLATKKISEKIAGMLNENSHERH